MTDVVPEGGPDMQFQAYAAAGRFMIQRGVKTGQYVFYPRAIAPGTGEELEWVEASGRGTVYSATVVRNRAPQPAASIVLVDLDEGPRMMSGIVGLDPTRVSIGLAVRAKIVRDGDCHVVVFEPADRVR